MSQLDLLLRDKKRDSVELAKEEGARNSGRFENMKYVSDSERKSYVEYINKHLVLARPVDPESPTDLFDVIAEGVLLPQLVNLASPGIIPEKKLLQKKELSLFEININHEATIQAAKDIGCTVVNIGAEDLSNRKQHLALGLLWQIIKKSLLKNVTESTEDLVCRLEEELGVELDDDISPEQALMHWFNYHLKKMNGKQLKNFTGDIQDSEAYAYVLKRIAPHIFLQEDLDEILAEKDILKRASILIECAKKVLGEGEAMFVSANDIINGNPRLNLAFAVTLFNKYPELEPAKPMMGKETLRRTRKRTINSGKNIECDISILIDGPPILNTGKLALDESTGVAGLTFDNNEMSIRREDVQVISTGLWDFGLLLTSKKPYKLGALNLSGKSIYFSGIDDAHLAELNTFFERCKRFMKTKNSKNDEEEKTE